MTGCGPKTSIGGAIKRLRVAINNGNPHGNCLEVNPVLPNRRHLPHAALFPVIHPFGKPGSGEVASDFRAL